MSDSPPVNTTDLIVIGTAGRHYQDQHTLYLYQRMQGHLRRLIERLAQSHPVRLVSGGAPWADHLAVSAFLDGQVERLSLHLPADFDRTAATFVPPTGKAAKTAETINRLHRDFSAALGRDTLRELAQALERPGCEVALYNGFFKRNDAVAAHEGGLVAYTFFEPAKIYYPGDAAFQTAAAAGLTGGGTAYTWEKAWGVRWKLHQSLPALALS